MRLWHCLDFDMREVMQPLPRVWSFFFFKYTTTAQWGQILSKRAKLIDFYFPFNFIRFFWFFFFNYTTTTQLSQILSKRALIIELHLFQFHQIHILIFLLQVLVPNPFKKSHNNWILHLFQFHQIFWFFFFKYTTTTQWGQILSKRATIIEFYTSFNVTRYFDSSSSSAQCTTTTQ